MERRPCFVAGAWSAAAALLVSGALAQGPLAAKINVTPVAVYTGSSPLPKPQKILVYDFAVNPEDVQVDKLQALRPRHLITGDESQAKIAAGANKKYYLELVKALQKTGIPVEHVAIGATPSENAMLVQGSFTSLKQGTKAERDTVGMGTGSADVETKVDVHLKTPSDTILLSQFQTDTKAAPNAGSALPLAAGLNPAGVAAKSTITDRRKTLNAYASRTADETAKEIFKSMAAQGWIKTNDKGEVAE
jgi:translation initiation factor IF-2